MGGCALAYIRPKRRGKAGMKRRSRRRARRIEGRKLDPATVVGAKGSKGTSGLRLTSRPAVPTPNTVEAEKTQIPA